jgi:hypothetical protein
MVLFLNLLWIRFKKAWVALFTLLVIGILCMLPVVVVLLPAAGPQALLNITGATLLLAV